MRYLLQQSKSVADGWVCTDTETQIVIQWIEGRFNETQRVTPLDDKAAGTDALALARAMREMTDWLLNNNNDKL